MQQSKIVLILILSLISVSEKSHAEYKQTLIPTVEEFFKRYDGQVNSAKDHAEKVKIFGNIQAELAKIAAPDKKSVPMQFEYLNEAFAEISVQDISDKKCESIKDQMRYSFDPQSKGLPLIIERALALIDKICK
jgi:hypothetical protein